MRAWVGRILVALAFAVPVGLFLFVILEPPRSACEGPPGTSCSVDHTLQTLVGAAAALVVGVGVAGGMWLVARRQST
jgi:hypothetical protein